MSKLVTEDEREPCVRGRCVDVLIIDVECTARQHDRAVGQHEGGGLPASRRR